METITSPHNPKIREIIGLRKANQRKKNGLIIVEGFKEIEMALKAGFVLEQLYLCDELVYKKASNINSDKAIKVTKQVFEKISMRENPDGCLGLFKPKFFDFRSLILNKDPVLLILETVEKPGNLGAILRTAEAAGVSGIILCDAKTDIYNPNVIRASLGAVFLVPTIMTTNQKALDFLKKNKIRIISTLTDSNKPYYKINTKKSVAFVVGAEHEGLSNFWKDNSDEHILIPMFGQIDSLNASVSAAIVVYEAVRQRQKMIDNRNKK